MVIDFIQIRSENCEDGRCQKIYLTDQRRSLFLLWAVYIAETKLIIKEQAETEFKTFSTPRCFSKASLVVRKFYVRFTCELNCLYLLIGFSVGKYFSYSTNRFLVVLKGILTLQAVCVQLSKYFLYNFLNIHFISIKNDILKYFPGSTGDIFTSKPIQRLY